MPPATLQTPPTASHPPPTTSKPPQAAPSIPEITPDRQDPGFWNVPSVAEKVPLSSRSEMVGVFHPLARVEGGGIFTSECRTVLIVVILAHLNLVQLDESPLDRCCTHQTDRTRQRLGQDYCGTVVF
jgi:hypothetical protein